MLARLHEHGWTPETVPGTHGGHTLFRHALIGHDDLVALRPSSAVADDPDLIWRPLTPDPPHETLALASIR